MLDTDRGSSTTGQTWGRVHPCNGADALVGGQFPDKFSTEWHCLEDVSPEEFTDEMTDT
jgi:hypothetical protein